MVELPLFPLDTVLFPGMPIQLHIFEPRYILMMNTCIEKGAPFGVVLIRKGAEAGGKLAEPCMVGCTASILHVQPLEAGRMNLIAIGQERFRIQSLHYDLPYLVGMVEVELVGNPRSVQLLRAMRRFRPAVMRYLALLQAAEPETVDIDLPLLPSLREAAFHIFLAAAGVSCCRKSKYDCS